MTQGVGLTRELQSLVETDARGGAGARHLALRLADREGLRPVQALAYLGWTGYRTYAAPQRFAAIDGHTYRVKHRAQQGLAAELIGGRLANLLSVGPAVEIIEIGRAALPRDGGHDHYLGHRFGAIELEDVVNSHELALLTRSERMVGLTIDWESWASVLVVETWINAGDAQAILRLSDGRVFSVDHGDCFRDLLKGPPTNVVVPAVPGVRGVGCSWSQLDRAIGQVETLPEAAIIRAVAAIPDDDEWRAPFERRLRIAEWLIKRQTRLREVLEPWSRLAS